MCLITFQHSCVFLQLGYCIALVVGYLMLRGQFSLHASQFNVYAVSSGAMAYGLSFYFYLWGMKYIPTSLSAILLCLTPIFGVSLSVLFLSETINSQNMVGFAMILLSSIFITRQSTATEPRSAASF